MNDSQRLIRTLKLLLRQRQITYAQVAESLQMSLGNVKRLFASERITLDRIEAICRVAGIELGDLFQLYEASRQRISRLSEEQERELVADPALLFTAVSVRNGLSYEDILGNFQIDEHQLIRCLAQLDRIKIIDLLPGNRIRLRVAENFRWIAGGPIEHFYEQVIQAEFLKSGFDDEENPRVFLSGFLGEASKAVLRQRLRSLADEVAELNRQDRSLPVALRHNVGILFAMREWEFTLLQPFQRPEK